VGVRLAGRVGVGEGLAEAAVADGVAVGKGVWVGVSVVVAVGLGVGVRMTQRRPPPQLASRTTVQPPQEPFTGGAQKSGH
jgi:hypothetical protein